MEVSFQSRLSTYETKVILNFAAGNLGLFAYNNIATEIVAILEKRKDVQMKKILKEIEKALKEEMYYSALALTLTLPDICGRAEYGKKSNRERYEKWMENYVIQDFENPDELSQFKSFTPKNCWELRNSILHSGNKKTKFKQLYLTNGNLFSITLYKKDSKYNLKLTIGVKYFCSKICKAAETYYNENKEKFNFLNDIFIT